MMSTNLITALSYPHCCAVCSCDTLPLTLTDLESYTVSIGDILSQRQRNYLLMMNKYTGGHLKTQLFVHWTSSPCSLCCLMAWWLPLPSNRSHLFSDDFVSSIREKIITTVHCFCYVWPHVYTIRSMSTSLSAVIRSRLMPVYMFRLIDWAYTHNEQFLQVNYGLLVQVLVLGFCVFS